MYIQRLTKFVCAFLLCVAMASSCCSSVLKTRITSCELAACNPVGLRKLEAELLLGVDNPSKAFTLSNVKIVVSENGKVIANIALADISVDKKCSRVYSVPASADLSGISMLGALQKIAGGSLGAWNFELSADLSRGLIRGKHLEYSLSAEDLLALTSE